MWFELTNKYQAGITVDYSKPEAAQLLKQMKEDKFYTIEPDDELFWKEDACLKNLA